MIRTTRRLNERGPARKLRSEINKLWDAIEGQRIASTPSVRAKRTRNGVALEVISKAGTGPGSEVQRFKVTGVTNQYLTCRKVDKDGDEISSTNYNVMRPRCTWHDDEDSLLTGADADSLDAGSNAQSRTYTVTIDVSGTSKSFSVTQTIYPIYSVGSLIYGIKPIIGGTVEVSDAHLIWIDLNVDARHWRMPPQATEVCVDNEVKYALFPRSEASD